MKRLFGILAAFGLALASATPALAAQYVPGPIGSHPLREGQTGPAVRVLQADLAGFGYPVRVTGLFGPGTLAALLAFQTQHGLSATGVMDEGTYEALLLQGGWTGSGSAPVRQTPDRTVTMVATAYGPSLQDNYPYGATDYFGQPLRVGDVAVDPSVIPLGTRLFITGYNSPYLPPGGLYAVADDEGDAIRGDRIDIFINGTESQVNSFGIQDVRVTILGHS
jgi:3D (Asp-Asp-Asp) domain-containing protein